MKTILRIAWLLDVFFIVFLIVSFIKSLYLISKDMWMALRYLVSDAPELIIGFIIVETLLFIVLILISMAINNG